MSLPRKQRKVFHHTGWEEGGSGRWALVYHLPRASMRQWGLGRDHHVAKSADYDRPPSGEWRFASHGRGSQAARTPMTRELTGAPRSGMTFRPPYPQPRRKRFGGATVRRERRRQRATLRTMPGRDLLCRGARGGFATQTRNWLVGGGTSCSASVAMRREANHPVAAVAGEGIGKCIRKDRPHWRVGHRNMLGHTGGHRTQEITQGLGRLENGLTAWEKAIFVIRRP